MMNMGLVGARFPLRYFVTLVLNPALKTLFFGDAWHSETDHFTV